MLLALWLTVSAQACAWPAPCAPLSLLPLTPRQAGAKKLRVALDAGHGSFGNVGARSCLCENEADFTLPVAKAVGAALEATGAFEVLQLRTQATGASYAQRIRAAERFHADVIVSLHYDVRGEAFGALVPEGESASGERSCWRNDADTGFAVLWNDGGEDARLKAGRQAYGRALATALAQAGFGAYEGNDYGIGPPTPALHCKKGDTLAQWNADTEGAPCLYENDAVPGGFIDRHLPRQRVWWLHAPRIPSLVVETHHALSRPERLRWKQPATVEAFAAAVAAGLLQARAALPEAPAARKPPPHAGADAGVLEVR